LKVRPQINEGDNIKMDIEQEVSDVSNTAITGATDITTNKRSIKTTVLVEDGQTLVLGGLIDDQINDTREKVPFLGDVPLLGSLFKYRTTQKNKRNLMVFLHPTILRDPTTADYYSRSKYDDLRLAQQGLFEREDDFTKRSRPNLPELHLYFEGQRVNRGSTDFTTILPTSDASPALEPIVPALPDAEDDLIDNAQRDAELLNLLQPNPDLVASAADSNASEDAILKAAPTRNAAVALEDSLVVEDINYASSEQILITEETGALPLDEVVTDLAASASLESDLIGSDDALTDLLQQTLE